MLQHSRRIFQRSLCVFVMVFFVVGCAGTQTQQSYGYQSYSATSQEKESKKRGLEQLRLKLENEKNKEEIERLKTEIEELEKRIKELEDREKEEIARDEKKSGSGATSGSVNVGPKGGCYKISKNGKKYYVPCK